MTNESRLSELLAKQDIHECIMKYASGSDRYDDALIRSAFHSDAIVDREKQWTVDDWVELSMNRDRSRARMHHIGNVLIEVDGTTALAETYWLAYQVWTKDDARYVRTRAARYVDRFECRHGEWRILYRGVVDDWSFTQQVGPEIEQGLSTYIGQPFPHDAVYALRNGSIGLVPSTESTTTKEPA